MPQEPFTTAGVQQKLDDLYLLSDTLLQAEANAFRADFRQWVKDNFTLDTTQETYLDGMSEEWIRYAACQASLAMAHRLDIVLDFDGTPPYLSKLVRTESTMLVTQGPTGVDASGQLTFTVVYES